MQQTYLDGIVGNGPDRGMQKRTASLGVPSFFLCAAQLQNDACHGGKGNESDGVELFRLFYLCNQNHA